MAVFVTACNEADLDVATGTCAAPYWIPQPSVIPALTIADAQQIGMACALLLGTAWAIRQVGKAVNKIG